jgi:ABC-2 type transport system ATP-binding protein
MDDVIAAEGLRKRYGATQALDGLDLTVRAGTVCGLLGPNGAGKTTAVRILATLLRFDAGRARVAGHDVARDPAGVRASIGLTGQEHAIDRKLTGRQNLEMFGRLFHLDARAARRRADELLDRFDLADAADRKARGYSGGMLRRLDLAASFILRPKVLFLDEPTTGQDPRNRTEVWDVVRSLVADGTTVLLTTHHLDEADRLADQIFVIDRGRVIAGGTPEQLKAQVGASQVEVLVTDPARLPDAAAALTRACAAEATVDDGRRTVSVPIHDRVRDLGAALRALEDAGIAAEDVALRRPTLDEVFLSLTGRAA